MNKAFLTMTKLLFQVVLIFLFTSCLSSKYLIPKKWYYEGVLQTCKTDSTALTDDSIIVIKTFCSNCKTNINFQCDNKPDNIDSLRVWPAELFLIFRNSPQNGLYNFGHSPRQKKLGKESLTHFSSDKGTVKYDHKKKTLEFKSSQSVWAKIFNVHYSKRTNTLTLISGH